MLAAFWKQLGMSLTLFEELNRAQSMENEHGYTTQVLLEDHRGCPRLDVEQVQLEYLVWGSIVRRLQKSLVLA